MFPMLVYCKFVRPLVNQWKGGSFFFFFKVDLFHFYTHFIFNHEVQILNFGDFSCTNLCLISMSAGVLMAKIFDAPKIFPTMLSNCLAKSLTTFFSKYTQIPSKAISYLIKSSDWCSIFLLFEQR